MKFGASAVALNLWKEYLHNVQEDDPKVHVRILTDISGPAYTLIAEQIHETFTEAEPARCRLVQRSDGKDFYQKFILIASFTNSRWRFRKYLEVSYCTVKSSTDDDFNRYVYCLKTGHLLFPLTTIRFP